MAFAPDIIVTALEGAEIALIVAAKTSLRGPEDVERQLKTFMSNRGAPVGLLVTPERLWLYRNQYTSLSEDSIVQVGEFDVRDVLNFDPGQSEGRDEFAFERLLASSLPLVCPRLCLSV